MTVSTVWLCQQCQLLVTDTNTMCHPRARRLVEKASLVFDSSGRVVDCAEAKGGK